VGGDCCGLFRAARAISHAWPQVQGQPLLSAGMATISYTAATGRTLLGELERSDPPPDKLRALAPTKIEALGGKAMSGLSHPMSDPGKATSIPSTEYVAMRPTQKKPQRQMMPTHGFAGGKRPGYLDASHRL